MNLYIKKKSGQNLGSYLNEKIQIFYVSLLEITTLHYYYTYLPTYSFLLLVTFSMFYTVSPDVQCKLLKRENTHKKVIFLSGRSSKRAGGGGKPP